jgi:hypothetical protein
MNAEAIYVEASTVIHCPACFIPFWVPKGMQALRRQDHGSFYCPNGHSMSYSQETEAEKASRERDEARAARDKAWVERDKAERDRDAAKKDLETVTRRQTHGVCIHCHRTFQNVARHMSTKHPEKVAA